jgi:hypothetical protein
MVLVYLLLRKPKQLQEMEEEWADKLKIWLGAISLIQIDP